MSEMDPKFPREWLHIAAELLDKAAEEFGNHGCNDYVLPDWMVAADRLALDTAFMVFNGDPEMEPSDSPYASDASLMSFFAEKLREMAGPVPPVQPERAAEKRDEAARQARETLVRAQREAADAADALARARAKVQKLEKGGAS